MKINKKAKRAAGRLFRSCLLNDALDDKRVRDTVQIIVARGRRDSAAVLAHFYRLVKLETARYAARISSAVPLTADLQTKIEAGLAKRYGPKVTTAFVHDPTLIGGVRVQVGSDVYDRSIKAGLAALEKSF